MWFVMDFEAWFALLVGDGSVVCDYGLLEGGLGGGGFGGWDGPR